MKNDRDQPTSSSLHSTGIASSFDSVQPQIKRAFHSERREGDGGAIDGGIGAIQKNLGYPELKKIDPNTEEVKTTENNQDKSLTDLLSKVPEEKANYAYAEGKWTLKELLQHLIDCERIFCFRALAIARKDPANLPGFEEDDYAAASAANRRSWASLGEEMKTLRISTKQLFASFSEEMLEAKGKFNNNEGQVKKLGFIILGHTVHHVRVAEERYLNPPGGGI